MFGVVDLGLVGRHLLAPSPVRDGRFRGAKAGGGSGRVHRHVAAADDDYALATQIREGIVRGGRRAGETDGPQEVQPAVHAIELLARYAQGSGARSPGREQNRVEADSMKLLDVRDPRARGDLHADGRDVGDVLLHDLGRKAVGGQGDAKEPAGHGRGLEDLDRVSAAGELPGGSQTGGTGSDNGHPLAVGGWDFYVGAAFGGVVRVGGEALQAADGERALGFALRALEGATAALAFARGIAGTAEGPDERRRLEHELEGFLVFATPNQGHVAVGLDAGRAGVGAGRRAGPLDDGLLRHGLGEGDVCRPPRD